jgi:hypothetical protein
MTEVTSYPKWIFHKELPARIVYSKEQHSVFGEEWQESPAAFVEKEKVPKNIEDMALDELQELAIKAGVSKKKVKDLTKEQILELLKGAS